MCYYSSTKGYRVEMKYLSSQDIKDRQRNISDIKPYKNNQGNRRFKYLYLL